MSTVAVIEDGIPVLKINYDEVPGKVAKQRKAEFLNACPFKKGMSVKTTHSVNSPDGIVIGIGLRSDCQTDEDGNVLNTFYHEITVRYWNETDGCFKTGYFDTAEITV